MPPAADGVDAAILAALGLDGARAAMAPHGASGFASTFRLTAAAADGARRSLFVKTGAGRDAERMFRGEYASLNAIADAVPGFCPRAHAHGAMASAPGRFFLATDFVEFSAGADDDDDGAAAAPRPSLAAKLARLHTTPAPAPAAGAAPAFGFPVATCCGATAQDNGWRASWAGFYADGRLRAVLRACVAARGADAGLADAVERVAAVVVPRLLGDGRLSPPPVPVVVHGDLWSGNRGRGRIGGGGAVEEVVFDPAAVYGHSEYELGIMRMFGGFGPDFWSEYLSLVPKAEPLDEWDDRITLYELYHHLNHFALFGGGYRGGAMSIMRKLLAKYGG